MNPVVTKLEATASYEPAGGALLAGSRLLAASTAFLLVPACPSPLRRPTRTSASLACTVPGTLSPPTRIDSRGQLHLNGLASCRLPVDRRSSCPFTPLPTPLYTPVPLPVPPEAYPIRRIRQVGAAVRSVPYIHGWARIIEAHLWPCGTLIYL